MINILIRVFAKTPITILAVTAFVMMLFGVTLDIPSAINNGMGMFWGVVLLIIVVTGIRSL